MSTAEPLLHLMQNASRTHDAMVAAADALIADLGLSHARHRVLAVLIAEGAPRTVSQLARTMGYTRQGVQRLADDLTAVGLISSLANPDHARARLMSATQAGLAAHAEAERRQTAWAATLAHGLPPTWLEMADELLTLLRRRAESLPS